MKLKLLKGIAVGMVLAMGLTACGDGTSNESQQTESQQEASSQPSVNEDAASQQDTDKEPITLRFMWWGGDERATATLDVIDQFTELYPWITIEAEYGGSDGYQEKLTTQLSSGTIADIFQMGTGWMPDYVSSEGDYFVDFNEYPELIDLSGFDAGFLETNGKFDGHQYGLPTGIAGTALIYNTALAEQIGLDFTKEIDWDSLIEMGHKVHEYDDSLYLLTISQAMLRDGILIPYMQQLTGNGLVIDGSQIGFTEEQLVQGLTYIRSLYDNDVTVPISKVVSFAEDLQTDPNWINQKYVGLFCFTSTAETNTAACPDAEFAASASLPMMEGAKDDGFYNNCPQYMCVSKKSEHIEEALMFLDYFYNNETAAITLNTVRSVPPTAMAQQICADNELISNIVKTSVDTCRKYSGQIVFVGTEIQAILDDMVMKIAYGEETPEEVAADGMKLIEGVLSR